mgnify:CR=1 FL=1
MSGLRQLTAEQQVALLFVALFGGLLLLSGATLLWGLQIGRAHV